MIHINEPSSIQTAEFHFYVFVAHVFCEHTLALLAVATSRVQIPHDDFTAHVIVSTRSLTLAVLTVMFATEMRRPGFEPGL